MYPGQLGTTLNKVDSARHNNIQPTAGYTGLYNQPVQSAAMPNIQSNPYFPPGTVIMQPTIYQQPNGANYTVYYPLSTCIGRKKALLVGINYTGTTSALSGCHNDVYNMSQFLEQVFHYPMKDSASAVLLLDDPNHHRGDFRFLPTRANIMNAIGWLIAGAQPGDSLFFHYSGHGGRQVDLNGDEADGYDETLLPLDYETAGQIVDDELHEWMVKRLPPGVRLTAVIDACHSGTMLDLPYVYNENGQLVDQSIGNSSNSSQSALRTAMHGRPIQALAQLAFGGVSNLMRSAPAPASQSQPVPVNADVVMFAGCNDNQTSADTRIAGKSTGAMSFALLESLRNNPRQSYLQILQSTHRILQQRQFGQVPQLSSGHVMDMNAMFIM